MSLLFFMFVSTLFLFFFANVVLSPERNPRFHELSEHSHAPSKETIEIVAAVLNGVAILSTIVLIALVPFFRVIAAFSMLALVGRFVYARFTSKTESEDTLDPSPLPDEVTAPLSPMEQAELDARGESHPE